jgi:hypothetical protein
MHDGNRVLGWPQRVLPLALRVGVAITAAAGLAMLAAACGGSPGSRVAQRGSTATQSSPSPNGSGGAANAGGSTHAQHAQLEREYLSFARCVRSHGVSDFPDPVIGSGGHPGFHLQGGTDSDLNSSNPAFQRGVDACQHLVGHQFRFVFTPSGVGKGA